jgi:hypothetical protein
VVLPPFSPSLFSLPRLGVSGAAAILLICAEAQASSFSSSRVLQHGEEDAEMLRKNDNGVGSAGGGDEGEWQWFAVGIKTMATNGFSSPVLKQTRPCFQILYSFPPLFLFVFLFLNLFLSLSFILLSSSFSNLSFLLCFQMFLSFLFSKPSPLQFFFSPIFIGNQGRGSPYLVQVQGMVAWDGFCVAAAGHGLPLPSSWWQGMVGMGSAGFLGQVGW